MAIQNKNQSQLVSKSVHAAAAGALCNTPVNRRVGPFYFLSRQYEISATGPES